MLSHLPSTLIASIARQRRTGILLASLLPVFLLGGCAADMAYRDAQQLASAGKTEESLARYQDAIKLEPDNIEFRTAYATGKEKAIAGLEDQAQRLLETGRNAEAEKIYDRVLAIDPADERAHAQKRLLAGKARHQELLKAAAADIGKNDKDAASAALAVILQEDPENSEARAMRRTLGDMAASAVPAAVQANPDAVLAEAYKRPISIEFRDAPLKQILEAISRSAGMNFLFDKDIKLDQKASIILKDSTIEAALYYMLLTNNLEQQVMDANTVLIYPNTADKQKEYQQVMVRSFLLSNAKAATVAESLKNLLKLRDVVVDEKLNMLIIRDVPEALRLAEKVVAMQDVPEPEVMLDVEVLEVSREKMLNLGIDWPGGLSLTPLSKSGGSSLTLNDLRGMNGDSLGVGIGPATINAQKTDTDADILANPRIRVLNHEKAKIVVGDKVPSITSSAVPSANGTIISQAITYLDVGMKLDVEPTIYLDNDVAIRIGLEVSSIVGTQTLSDGTTAYTIGTRSAQTMLRLKDGENQVLAGLINAQDSNSANKIPALGEIPVLGRLFGSTKHDKLKTEIVLSITPHLIRNVKRPDAELSAFLSGTGNSLRRRPDFAPRGKAAAPESRAHDSGNSRPENAEPANKAAPSDAPKPENG